MRSAASDSIQLARWSAPRFAHTVCSCFIHCSAGFHVVDYSYASGGDMDTIAAGLMDTVCDTVADLSARAAAAAAGPASPPAIEELCVSFVCHSMGGLVLRAAISSGRF